MKDPAFLFYPNDWIGGTMGMTFEEKGAYMELLMLQFNRGHMTSHMIAHVLGQGYGQLWDKIKDKFDIDESGLFYNKRLEMEQIKRKSFTDSRKNNIKGKNQHSKQEENKGHIKGHMTSHMENEDENEDINKEGKEVTGEKGTKKKEKKQVPELQYPFTSELFIETWNILVSTPKWKKKIPHSLQLALNSLGKYNEEFSIMLMNKAIENGWQGVTYADTDEQYQKWLKSNGNSEIRTTGNSVGKITAGNNAADKVASVGRLADMAETILQSLVPKNV